MKILTTLLCLFLFQFSQAQLVVNDPNSEIRNVSSFSAIQVSGGIEVFLSKGNKQVVAVSNSKKENNSMIKTEVVGGVLRIYPQSNSGVFRNVGRMRAYVAYSQLSSVKLTGAAELNITDELNSDELTLTLSGASEIKGKIRADRLKATLSGASDARLTGTATEIQLTCSGASDFKSADLVTERCIAVVSGASDVRVTVNQSLKVKASGASDFFYKGTPQKTEIEKSGGSDVGNRN